MKVLNQQSRKSQYLIQGIFWKCYKNTMEQVLYSDELHLKPGHGFFALYVMSNPHEPKVYTKIFWSRVYTLVKLSQ